MRNETPLDPVAAAIEIARLIPAERDWIECERRLPRALVAAMIERSLFQLSLPAAIGGPEVDPLTSFYAIEALARVDGSVAWCASIATSLSLYCGAWLPPEVGRSLLGAPPDARIAGSARPEGIATVSDGGYRVSGQWDFASGVKHANWLYCTCVVHDGDGPRKNAAGVPLLRHLMVPAASAQILDTWSVVGMSGTGSHDFVLDDEFVPEAHTFSLADPPQIEGPLYNRRIAQTCSWTGTVATALGIARGAMDAFAELGLERGSSASATLLADRPGVQIRVAEAEAILSASRAFVVDAIGAAWEAVKANREDPGLEIARARIAITHAIHEAVRVVDHVFDAAGTNSAYRRHGLERRFRDIHVAVHHAAGQRSHLEKAGQALLGVRHDEWGW